MSPGRSREEKSLSSRRTKNRRSSQKTNLVDTYGAWLGAQARRKPTRPTTARFELEMPKDTMEEWLRKQPVIEKEARKEITPPLNSTEEWLRKQVAEKLSKERETPEATQKEIII